MRAVALALALTTTACFPHNARHRTYAKLGEGAALATGIVMLFFVNSGADCDQMRTPGLPAEDCKSDAKLLSGVGLGLIIAGLTGFIATVSTTPDDKPTQPTDRLAPTEPMPPTEPASTAPVAPTEPAPTAPVAPTEPTPTPAPPTTPAPGA